MVIFDVNVLIYAMRNGSAHHDEARDHLKRLDRSGESLGWHPAILASVIRIATNPKSFAPPATLEECQLFLSELTANPRATRITESDRFWRTFTELLDRYNVRGPAVSDFYWAALAIDQGATLCSADQKFGQIKELRWHNLLG